MNQTPFCSVKFEHSISENRVRDLLCAALEGGSNYWYRNAHYRLRSGLKYEDFRNGSQTLEEYWHPLELIPFVDGCCVILEANVDEWATYELNRESMQKGIALMAEKYPQHFKDFLEEDDASTADVFLQLSLFGEIIFG